MIVVVVVLREGEGGFRLVCFYSRAFVIHIFTIPVESLFTGLNGISPW